LKEQKTLAKRMSSKTRQGRMASANSYKGGAYAEEHWPDLITTQKKKAPTQDRVIKQHGQRQGEVHLARPVRQEQEVDV